MRILFLTIAAALMCSVAQANSDGSHGYAVQQTGWVMAEGHHAEASGGSHGMSRREARQAKRAHRKASRKASKGSSGGHSYAAPVAAPVCYVEPVAVVAAPVCELCYAPAPAVVVVREPIIRRRRAVAVVAVPYCPSGTCQQ